LHEIKRFCRDFLVDTIIKSKCTGPDRITHQGITYNEYCVKNFILNWIFKICYKSYYVLGTNPIEKYKKVKPQREREILEKRLLVQPLTYRVEASSSIIRENYLEEIDDLDDILTIVTKGIDIANVLNREKIFKIANINIHHIKVLLATKQQAHIYHFLQSKGLDMILWRLKPLIRVAKPFNLLTSTAIVLKGSEFEGFSVKKFNKFKVLMLQGLPVLKDLLAILKLRTVKDNMDVLKFRQSVSFILRWIVNKFARIGFFDAETVRAVKMIYDSKTRPWKDIISKRIGIARSQIAKLHSEAHSILKQFFLEIWEIFDGLNTQNLKIFTKLFRLLFKTILGEELSSTQVLELYLDKLGKLHRYLEMGLIIEDLFLLKLGMANFERLIRGEKPLDNIIVSFAIFISGREVVFQKEQVYGNFIGLIQDLFRGNILITRDFYSSGRSWTYSLRNLGLISISSKFKFSKTTTVKPKIITIEQRAIRIFKYMIREYHYNCENTDKHLITLGKHLNFI
jgi:hypothetical protein